MADKGPGSTGRSSNKRLARAKIKPTDEGIKSSKGRPAQDELSKAEAKKARRQKLTAIAVGAFAVIMALSMMLPSLTYIFGNPSQQAVEEQADEQESETSSDTETDETEESSETESETEADTGMASVDKDYKAVVDPLEAKLPKDEKDWGEKDLATLLSLGGNYTSWANQASLYASEDDADTVKHVDELYAKALNYYDHYIAINDSPAAKVSRAMCQYYSGDTENAVKALEALTQDESGYGPAWANLGMIYEYSGSQDKAKECYQKAIEADPDDEYGVKTYANRRIAAMAAQTEDLKEEGVETTANDKPTTGAGALEDALGNDL